MLFNLSEKNNIANQYIAELRDARIQTDRMRFRKNMERMGSIFAYEISKHIHYHSKEIETPLGVAQVSVPDDYIVIGSILRAGLPIHQGILGFFDQADSAFISAYRKHHKDGTFEIKMEYITCPDLSDSVFILTDPMLATGSSFDAVLKLLEQNGGQPKEIHIVTIISSRNGLNFIKRLYPNVHIWVGAIDEELTAKAYIVPGLGDAGDLMFGAKIQE